MKYGKLFRNFRKRFGIVDEFSSNKVSELTREELLQFAKLLFSDKNPSIPSNYVTVSSDMLKHYVYQGLLLIGEDPQELIASATETITPVTNQDIVELMTRKELLEEAQKAFDEHNRHIPARFAALTMYELRHCVWMAKEYPNETVYEEQIVEVDPKAGETCTEI